MQLLYRKFTIPSFDRIVNELLNIAEKANYTASKEVKSWVVPISDTLNECPVLKDFLQSRLKKPIQQIKFYYSPGMQGLGAHVDGSTPKIPFGMNFPLLNTKETFWCLFALVFSFTLNFYELKNSFCSKFIFGHLVRFLASAGIRMGDGRVPTGP